MKLAAPDNGIHPAWPELEQAIYWFDNNSPRSLQEHLGPSELGTPCLRQLAFKMGGAKAVNMHADHWFAILGTAFHQWVAEALDVYQTTVLGRTGENRKYLIEHKVMVKGENYWTSGHTDVFDRDNLRVIDWKLMGTSSLKKFSKDEVRPSYRSQAHLYGKGWKQAGYDVREVCIVGLPRSNYLSGRHVWSEPFDESIADAALDRAASVDNLRQVLPIGMIPGGDDCTWCPFHRPHQPLSDTGCPGLDTGTST